MEHIASRMEGESPASASQTFVRPATPDDAPLVHRLYEATPDYFRIISIPTPCLEETQRELEAAQADPRRYTELVLSKEETFGSADPLSEGKVVGYLDYKIHYPEEGDATVNLLLISGCLQSRGYGRACISDLEKRLRGRVKRVLASIYGQNPRAEQFWKSLGYSFAIDAKPVLDWYAKEL